MRNRGFTLVEIMTAVSIFTIVMTISVGSIIGVFNTNRKSEALKAVMDNLNLAVESMSREIRFGTMYYCGVGIPLIAPQNCPLGGDAITFRAVNGDTVVYELTADGKGIEKSINGNSPLPLTSPDIVISDLTFYVLGTGADSFQPRVHVKLKGTAGVHEADRTDFTLQTMVSQRQLDR